MQQVWLSMITWRKRQKDRYASGPFARSAENTIKVDIVCMHTYMHACVCVFGQSKLRVMFVDALCIYSRIYGGTHMHVRAVHERMLEPHCHTTPEKEWHARIYNIYVGATCHPQPRVTGGVANNRLRGIPCFEKELMLCHVGVHSVLINNDMRRVGKE